MSTFKSSRPAVLELAARYKDIVQQIQKESAVVSSDDLAEVEEAEKVLFMEMCEICLWGNATDLSLLTSLSYEDIQKLQGSNARKESEKNIVVNELPAAFEILRKAKKAAKTSRVSIVLDNAGFELFVDLILAGYLLTEGLASEIVLHPKSIPWFVSDVVPKDFVDLLSALADPQAFYTAVSDSHNGKSPEPLNEGEVGNLKFLFDNWSHLHAEGKLMLRPSRFWTHPGSFWRMPHTAPEVMEDLKDSELVIFKGDLNYRKLAGDVRPGIPRLQIDTNSLEQAAWDPTTPFCESLGPLGKGSGIRSLALRTCKADVVVGLPPGKDEKIRHTEGGGGDSGARKWAWSGKWAVVQLCDGKT
jgi:damage-control phosphatase, subfamily III